MRHSAGEGCERIGLSGGNSYSPEETDNREGTGLRLQSLQKKKGTEVSKRPCGLEGFWGLAHEFAKRDGTPVEGKDCPSANEKTLALRRAVRQGKTPVRLS